MLENKQANNVFTHLHNEKERGKWAIIVGTKIKIFKKKKKNSTWMKI